MTTKALNRTVTGTKELDDATSRRSSTGRGLCVALLRGLAVAQRRWRPTTGRTAWQDRRGREEGGHAHPLHDDRREGLADARRSPFEAKYGVKVDVWRAGTDKVLQRTVAEAAAKRYDVDVIHFGSPEMEALVARENPAAGDVAGARRICSPARSRRTASGRRRCSPCGCRSTTPSCVKKEDLPKTYKDLLDPKWKGKLGIEAKDQDWFASVVDVMGGGEAGLEFFRDLVATNGVSVRLGHTLLNNMVISGEVPLALTVYNYMPEQAKKKGAPVDWFALEPAIARSNAVGVARRAPHPNAALLFYEYLLGEGQQYFVSMDYVPTQHEGRLTAQGREDPADRPGPLARRSRQVDQAVRRDATHTITTKTRRDRRSRFRFCTKRIPALRFLRAFVVKVFSARAARAAWLPGSRLRPSNSRGR